MAKIPANLTRIYVDEFALSAFLNAADLEVNQNTPVVTCFSDTGPRRIPADYDHLVNFGGLMDPAAGNIDDLVFNALNTDEDHYVLDTRDGTTEGKVGYEAIVRLSKQARTAKGGEAQMLNFDAVGSNGLARSAILRTATVTGTGNGTGQNLGATSAGTIFQVVYRVLAVTGTGSITLKVQESSDDGGGDAYADISGLTETFTAVGVARDTTIAATEAYKRLVVSAFSGFTNVTILVTAGRVAGT